MNTDSLAVGFEDLLNALANVSGTLHTTPLTFSSRLSELVNREIYLKWENKHTTGSFKERGAVNFIAQLSGVQREKGLCAASAGNHALALSYHAAKQGLPCTIVMPTTAPLVKIQSTNATGAKVILHGQTFDEAYQHAIALADSEGLAFVSAYDHPAIIAGQGTIGIELMEQMSDFDSVVVPIGGGGLIAGVATAIKAKRPNVFILGAQSIWAKNKTAGAYPSGKIPPGTIADGIGVKATGKLTGPIIDALVDDLVSLEEPEIARAVVHFLERERAVVEGSGAAALAAALKDKLPRKCKKIVLIVSGSNIDTNLLSRIIEYNMAERGRLFRVRVSVPDRPGSLSTVTTALANHGANVLEVFHDRSFSNVPGNVDIMFLLEVKNLEHKHEIIVGLNALSIGVKEI